MAWIGEIPEDWQLVRVCDLFRKKKITGRADAELLSVYREHGVVPKSSREDNMNRPSDDLSVYQFVRVGDLVLNKMKTWQGSIAVSKYEGIVSPAYYVARPLAKMSLEFAHHLLRSPNYIDRYAALSSGVRVNQWDLSYDDFKAMPVPMPSVAEQRAIADYLDRQTALIDQRLTTLAEKKAVLAGLRKATIHEAVTKGSTWNAETGLMEGLPNGWEASQAKRLLRFITSGSRGWAEYYADEGDIFLRIGNLTRETIELDLNDVQYVRLPANAMEGSRTRTREGDMLVSITADLGSIAVAPKLDKPAYVNQHIALCRPKKMVNPRWLGYAMVSLQSKQQMLNSGYGGTKIQLSLDDVRHVWLAVPPPDEQQRIADHLDRQTQQFDAQLATLDEQARVLKELRKAIIHEAVTGKIDLSRAESGKQTR